MRHKLSDDPMRHLNLLKYIFFSNIFTRVFTALPHRSGMFEFNIGKVPKTCLDWFYTAIKHIECVMNKRVRLNFGRFKV